MRLVRILTVAFALSVLSMQILRMPAQAPAPALPKLEHYTTASIDKSASPCDDFYQYADGKWLAANPIPSDQAFWGTISPLQLWNETLLRQALETNAAENPNRTPNEQKVGDFFSACMNEKGIDANADEWLRPELARIAQIKSRSDIAAEVAHLHRTIAGAWQSGDNQTDAAMLGFTGSADYDDATHNVAQFDQGGMGLPGRSFYLNQDDRSKQIRAKYLKHVQNMLVLGGEKPDEAKADAAVVMAMETQMAQAAMDPVARRDPKNLNNKMSLDQIKALAPSFDWDRYLKLVQAPASPHYIVTSPDFFKGLETMLQQQPLEHWKAYLRWQLLHGSATALSEPFVEENFDFYGRTLAGIPKMQPRWRRCVRSVDAYLGEALGQVYAEKAFPPASKQRAVQLVQDIEAALAKDIDAQSWMTAATKKQALVKLHATLNKIGYPDHWRNYSSVQIGRENYLADRQSATRFEFERWVHKIGQPVDRTEWGMTPPTINAYEDPQTNTINFPAGILQPPLFDPTQNDAVNYGAIGAVIGHETIHGFDDQGRKFDAAGNLRDWWTPDDAKAYEARGKCIADEYTQLIPEAGPGVKQDGRMTQGEDTADNGGIHLAFMALQAALARQGKDMDAKGSDGFTPRQRFFLAYAFVWSSQARQEAIRTLVMTDPHSYPKYRVNNVVSNMPEFWQAFGCHAGQKMVRANACRIW